MPRGLFPTVTEPTTESVAMSITETVLLLTAPLPLFAT